MPVINNFVVKGKRFLVFYFKTLHARWLSILNNHGLLRPELFIVHISRAINTHTRREMLRWGEGGGSLFINKQSSLSFVVVLGPPHAFPDRQPAPQPHIQLTIIHYERNFSALLSESNLPGLCLIWFSIFRPRPGVAHNTKRARRNRFSGKLIKINTCFLHAAAPETPSENTSRGGKSVFSYSSCRFRVVGAEFGALFFIFGVFEEKTQQLN